MAMTATVSALAAAFFTAGVLRLAERPRVPLDFAAGVGSVRDRIDECRAEHGDTPPSASGRITVLGEVGYPTTVELSGVDGELRDCLRTAMYSIRFATTRERDYVDLEGAL